jgi:hypothetical protein
VNDKYYPIFVELAEQIIATLKLVQAVMESHLSTDNSPDDLSDRQERQNECPLCQLPFSSCRCGNLADVPGQP